VVFVILLGLGGITGALSPVFLQPRNLSNVLRQASALGLVAIGQTFVILTHGIDLSVGSVATLANCVCATVMAGRPERVLPAILACLGVGAVAGLFNGFMITQFGLPDFIVTLGTMSAANGLMFLYTRGWEVGAITSTFRLLSEGSIGPLPMSMVIWILVAIMAALFLRYTRTGRHIYAVGGDPEVARLAGINVRLIKMLAYVLSGLGAAMGAIILTARLTVGDPISATGFQLDTIAAVVIGGTSLTGGRGGMIGSVIGALMLSVLSNMFNILGLSAFGQIILKGVLIIAVVAASMLGERTR
jgi:ribose/xylose/arabinose/galactoside ABC-type transport system permease subunit